MYRTEILTKKQRIEHKRNRLLKKGKRFWDRIKEFFGIGIIDTWKDRGHW